ncbi:Acetyltransferase (GNAT) family protein [Paenibacillus sp. UNC496MF]|uniref:GNAT family N-acetyltransferase n=1 Tax=Paenibacillus sp. UNC496MF TaxID=1502753 RepID=UPI0008E2E35A|nr:GNAT family N-acetyltransferase [Paenibacillus sp. UNC496MF]SFI35652.1 Acetyltransferase (GNAT) family protein [Paenibacillus sp. UNC496MF]
MKQNVKLRRLSELSYKASLTLWNEGFSGYYADMMRTLAQHVKYIGTANIRPEHSVVAVADGEPVGFVLTGLRRDGGRTLAWNGGTAVVPRYRGAGVGTAMMREAIRVYEELGVHAASLEAIMANDAAVALYRRCGYAIRKRVLILAQPKEPAKMPLFPGGADGGRAGSGAYALRRAHPSEAGRLRYYRGDAPWCSQWPNAADAEAALAADGNGETAGFALYKRSFGEDGTPRGVHLLQAGFDPARGDGREAAAFLLAALYGSADAPVRRTADNLPESSLAAKLLIEAGFETAFAQYVMELKVRP